MAVPCTDGAADACAHGVANDRTIPCADKAADARADGVADIKTNHGAVVLADIDHFKSFNERHGHDCGDLVLKQVASALTRTDGIAVRWGGEEFLLFLTNQSEDEAAQAIDHLRQQIKSLETIYEGRRLSVTMTFGVTTHRGFKPVDTLVKEADDRLRAGKQAGKDRIVTSIHH